MQCTNMHWKPSLILCIDCKPSIVRILCIESHLWLQWISVWRELLLSKQVQGVALVGSNTISIISNIKTFTSTITYFWNLRGSQSMSIYREGYSYPIFVFTFPKELGRGSIGNMIVQSWGRARSKAVFKMCKKTLVLAFAGCLFVNTGHWHM